MKCYSLKTDGNKKITANFRVREFKCQDGSDPIFISLELVEILQNVRSFFGKSVVINSGYRTVEHNKAIGGSAYSQHIYGKAADIKVSGIKPKVVAEYIETLIPKSGGIGVYSWGVHVDVREKKARWNG